MVISIIIFRGGYKIMRNAWMVLMEAVPQELDTDNVIEAIKSIPTLSMFMSFIYGELQQINIL